MRPPLQPWLPSLTSQSTSCFSERGTNLPVLIWVMPSTAATAEKAQQDPGRHRCLALNSSLVMSANLLSVRLYESPMELTTSTRATLEL
ncbi:unnamed protein product [Spirodela intermedia]|uniref:Uncharacterized protein n=2 Tax=Spirodela intermedia TaxID=51605 RepID=A0A7I8J7T7_SPIIN|nr:unnamed protein product [Spirodela intermedia]CAA6665805.1 unnamed protein product [Spirodela intermedia]CAA7402562.1 unnamed protein product [Spirodela intermedia]